MNELYGHITSTEQLKYIERKNSNPEPYIGITRDGKIYQYNKETDRLITISLSQLQEKLNITELEANRILNTKGKVKLDITTDSLAQVDKVDSKSSKEERRNTKKVFKQEVEKIPEYVTKEELIEFKKDILEILNEFLRNLKGRK